MGGYSWAGEAEETFPRSWRRLSSPSPLRSPGSGILPGISRIRFGFVRDALTFPRGLERADGTPKWHGGRRCSFGVNVECVKPFLLARVAESRQADEARDRRDVGLPLV